MDNAMFIVTDMPGSRPADFYLGYMEGCVFLDFDKHNSNKILLVRISFDGYGCCTIGEKAAPLEEEDSTSFKALIENNIADQIALHAIVKRAIHLNKAFIWADALTHYHLV